MDTFYFYGFWFLLGFIIPDIIKTVKIIFKRDE